MIFEQDQLLGDGDRFVAGTVAGFSILALDDSSRRRTFALYLLARVAQVGWCPNPTFSSALCMSFKNLCSNNSVNLYIMWFLETGMSIFLQEIQSNILELENGLTISCI